MFTSKQIMMLSYFPTVRGHTKGLSPPSEADLTKRSSYAGRMVLWCFMSEPKKLVVIVSTFGWHTHTHAFQLVLRVILFTEVSYPLGD